ncbi:MAG TPA: hypothetical protein VJ896_07190 [Bacteroidales bacterium]|nr:hypothetical protein [Bacteroidales bacterium]
MKKLSVIVLFLLISCQYSFAQNIRNMHWDKDFYIHITLANDSNYIMDIEELHHTSMTEQESESFTYIPTRLDNEFVQRLKGKQIDTTVNEYTNDESDKTLWSALHQTLGGGWVHFVNCLLYSLETGYLDITAPLMQRPETNWKPKPLTDSYKRTRRWEYYVPVHQRYAIREYKKKKSNNNLGDLKDIPDDFIQRFLNTSNKEYESMRKSSLKKELAKIDLIKILLGANYLGETQIKYIKSMVLKAMAQYAENKLPSVIIFDNFNAAVAMSLNEKGYQVEKIVFADEKFTSLETRLERTDKIKTIVNEINEVNKEVLQQKLKKYYN